jgi:hypothetical protein
MDYESPEILASYAEEELVAEAAVSTRYGGTFPTNQLH